MTIIKNDAMINRQLCLSISLCIICHTLCNIDRIRVSASFGKHAAAAAFNTQK
jgi:hypothetical protein